MLPRRGSNAFMLPRGRSSAIFRSTSDISPHGSILSPLLLSPSFRKCRGLRGERPTSPSGHVLKRASKHSTSRSASNKSRSPPAVEIEPKKKSRTREERKPRLKGRQKLVTPPLSEGEEAEEEEYEEEEEEEEELDNSISSLHSSHHESHPIESHAPQLQLDFGTTNLQVIENRPAALLSEGWHGLDQHLATPDEQVHEAPRTTALPAPSTSTGRPSLKVIFGGSEQRRSTGTLSGFARSRLFDSPRSKRRAATESNPRPEVWVRGPADLSGSEASDSEIEMDDRINSSSSRNSKTGREGPKRTLSGLAQSFNQDSEEARIFGGFAPSEGGSYPYGDAVSHHDDHTFYSTGSEPWMQNASHSQETSTAASSTSYLGSHNSESGAYLSMDLDVDLDLSSPSQNERESSEYFSSVPDAFQQRVPSPFRPSPFKSDHVYSSFGNYYYDQPFASSPDTTAATESSGRSSFGGSEFDLGPWGGALRMTSSTASISSGSGSGSSQPSSHHGHHSLIGDKEASLYNQDHGMMQVDLGSGQSQHLFSQDSSSATSHALPSSQDIDSHPELAALAFQYAEKEAEAQVSTPTSRPSGMVSGVE